VWPKDTKIPDTELIKEKMCILNQATSLYNSPRIYKSEDNECNHSTDDNNFSTLNNNSTQEIPTQNSQINDLKIISFNYL